MRRVIAVLAALAAALVSIMVVGSSSAQAASVTCQGIYVNVHVSSVNVLPGGECALLGSTVSGGVSVGTNASFVSCDTAIGGSFSATGAYVDIDPRSSIGGSVTINRPGAAEAVGVSNICNVEVIPGPEAQPNIPPSYATILCPWKIGGSVNLSNAVNGYLENTIGCGPWMHIGGPVMIVNNYAPVEFGDAYVHGSVTCVNNHPPAELFDVFAQSISSQCLLF